jgi:lipoyl(octanoyl) transferase
VHDELLFARVGLGPDAIDYLQAWDLQRQVHSARVAGHICDTCLLLEHQPVYTAGKRTEPLDRPLGDPGAPVIETDRGGKITWHGPGQLVGYPIVALPEPIDVVGYVRLVEQALIGVCAEFGVPASRVEGRSGVWVTRPGEPDSKVGAIGIRVARGVTMHGFALNCDCDLAWFGKIVPCGIRDAGVTSLSAQAGRRISVAEALTAAQRHLASALAATSVRVVDGLPPGLQAAAETTGVPVAS